MPRALPRETALTCHSSTLVKASFLEELWGAERKLVQAGEGGREERSLRKKVPFLALQHRFRIQSEARGSQAGRRAKEIWVRNRDVTTFCKSKTVQVQQMWEKMFSLIAKINENETFFWSMKLEMNKNRNVNLSKLSGRQFSNEYQLCLKCSYLLTQQFHFKKISPKDTEMCPKKHSKLFAYSVSYCNTHHSASRRETDERDRRERENTNVQS